MNSLIAQHSNYRGTEKKVKRKILKKQGKRKNKKIGPCPKKKRGKSK